MNVFVNFKNNEEVVFLKEGRVSMNDIFERKYDLMWNILMPHDAIPREENHRLQK